MLTEIQVEQFSYGLLHEENLSPKTIKDILAILRSILNYVNRQSNIMKPIEIVYPKNDYKEMRVLSEEEQRRFAQYLLTDMDECKFGVLLALLTGLRLGEICALRWSDISIRNQTICVRHTMQRLKNNDTIAGGKTKIVITAPKSNASFRVIPLNKTTSRNYVNNGDRKTMPPISFPEKKIVSLSPEHFNIEWPGIPKNAD